MERIDANKGGCVIEVNAKNKRLYFFIPIRGYEPIIKGECWDCDLVYKKTIELQAFILVGEDLGERVRQEPEILYTGQTFVGRRRFGVTTTRPINLEPFNLFVPLELETAARNIVGTTTYDNN